MVHDTAATAPIPFALLVMVAASAVGVLGAVLSMRDGLVAETELDATPVDN
jgi:hypothetical protein